MISAPECVADYACRTGEGPLWRPEEGYVYWTDIPNGRVFRYDPVTEEHGPVYKGAQVGGMTLQEDGALLLFREKGEVALWRLGAEAEVVATLDEARETRFNDVIADPRGRVFCGTMPYAGGPGRLYRLGPDGAFACVLAEVGLPNGMGFAPDGEHMYFTDSGAREIRIYDYDVATGELVNGRVFVRPEGDGVPDGLTVDAEGFVWSAFWDGARLARYDPEGREVARVEFPVKKVSSLAFAGPALDEAFVTTAGGDEKEANGPDAGALFRVLLGVRGVPEFRSRLLV